MTVSAAEPLPIDGLVNVRDLGGLRTIDGRTVRTRQVIRSDNLKALTTQGHLDLISVIDPRTVADLRMFLEVEGDGYALTAESVTVVNFPMIPQAGINAEQIAAGMADNLVDDYRRQIEVNADSIIGVLERIADATARPVVIHCTVGKDRTGIIVALLLDLLGVDHATIAADYHATSPNIAPIIERIKAAPVFRASGLADAPMWIFDSQPETMQEFLRHVTREYGGAESYVIAKGMTPQTVARLRADLLQD